MRRVEDEALQGLNIVATLSEAGIEAVGPYPTVSGALAAVEVRTFDAALLDINLNGVPSFDVAATLRQKGIPFAFVTAYERTLCRKSFVAYPLLASRITNRSFFLWHAAYWGWRGRRDQVPEITQLFQIAEHLEQVVKTDMTERAECSVRA